MDLARLLENVRAFEADAHDLFSMHEVAASRVVILSESYDRLTALNLKQDDLMRQALRSVEAGLYRGAHVLAWAAFVDFYEETLASDGLIAIRSARPKWAAASLVELRESVTEHQLIEAGRTVGILTKNDVKALLGLLNKRNECAHPSDFHPDLNGSLGYLTELMQRIGPLTSATPSAP